MTAELVLHPTCCSCCDQLASWQKTAQDENDRAQELEVRLEAAEARLAAAELVVQAAREVRRRHPGNGETADLVLDRELRDYDAAVPARGDRRAPEGGSTPPAAIALRPYAKLKPADIAKGEPTDLNTVGKEGE